MDKDSQMLMRLEALIRTEVPDYERKVKETSASMKFYFFFAKLFNPDFMTKYVTTAYPRVYFPKEIMLNTRTTWKILAHEWVHLRNAKRVTTVFHTFLYGLPHWLALLALCSLGALGGNLWWLLNLMWLVCIAPLPAYLRAREERSAYVTNLAINYWRYGSVLPSTKTWLAKQFYSSMYYFMWPFKSQVENWMDEEERKIIAGEYDDVSPYKELKELLEEIWPK